MWRKTCWLAIITARWDVCIDTHRRRPELFSHKRCKHTKLKSRRCGTLVFDSISVSYPWEVGGYLMWMQFVGKLWVWNLHVIQKWKRPIDSTLQEPFYNFSIFLQQLFNNSTISPQQLSKILQKLFINNVDILEKLYSNPSKTFWNFSNNFSTILQHLFKQLFNNFLKFMQQLFNNPSTTLEHLCKHI